MQSAKESDRKNSGKTADAYSVFTVSIAGEKLAIPVPYVRTIFSLAEITPVPRSHLCLNTRSARQSRHWSIRLKM